MFDSKKHLHDDVSCFYDFTITDRLRVTHLPKEGWGRRDPHDKVSKPMWQCEMVHSPYLSTNRENWIDTIIVDVDSKLDIQRYMASGLPRPRGFTARRTSRGMIADRPHLVWDLHIPIYRPDRSKAEWRAQAHKLAAWRNNIRKRLVAAISTLCDHVDDQEPGVTKNPAHSHWTYFSGEDRTWTLTQMGQLLTSFEKKQPSAPANVDEKTTSDGKPSAAQDVYRRTNTIDTSQKVTEGGRNCALFNALRPFGYAAKAADYSYDQMTIYIHEKGHQLNEMICSPPLEENEVADVARSVIEFSYHVYTGDGRHVKRGACAADITSDMSMKERQAVGGRHGADQNAMKHLKKIRDAIKDRDDFNVTTLAKELEMSRPTVRKYLKELGKLPSAQKVSNTVEQVEKTVLSGPGQIKDISMPAVITRRDGKTMCFWARENDLDNYYDAEGLPAPRHFVDPHVMWRANTEPPPANHAQN